MATVVYLTRALLEVLLETAADRDPEGVTIALAVTPAEELAGLDLPAGTPVFTHFYLPDAGRSIRAVFGVDLARPPGQTPGLFVSHPAGDRALTRRDDLREVVFVAIPPWDVESVVAYRRDGRRRELTLVDAEPPEESLP